MKKKLGILAVATVLCLTGCASGPDLSDIQTNMEAEYMAGLLLKYDANNEDMLDYDRSILNPTPSPTVAPTAKPTSQAQQTAGADSASGQNSTPAEEVQNYVQLSDIQPVRDVSLHLSTYLTKQSYGSDYATVSASEGHKLLIVKFRLKNEGSTEIKANMMKKNMSYSLEVDGSAVGSPLMTILENDLQYFNERIPAGKSRESVLVFDVDSSVDVSKVAVSISDGSKTAQVTLQ